MRTPALRFIDDIAPALQLIPPRFQACAKKIGGSLMRIYRDTRFSKDKMPYKTNIGIQFRHAASPGSPLLKNLKHKDFIDICKWTQQPAKAGGFVLWNKQAVLTKDLPSNTGERFEQAVPFMRFLYQALELGFD